RDLPDPVLEALDGESPHDHAARVALLEQPPEFLAGRAEVNENEAARHGAAAPAACESSIRTPLPESGCRKTIFLPSAPGAGRELISRNPCRWSSAIEASMSRTPKQMWWIPWPRLARNFATGESSAVGCSSSMELSPAGRNAVRTFCEATSSRCFSCSPSAREIAS